MDPSNNKIRQEKELLDYFTTLTHMQRLVDRTQTYFQGDYPPYDKLLTLSRFRKELEPMLTSLDIRLITPRPQRTNYYTDIPRGHKIYPSLWVSGFSEMTTRQDLYELFHPLDAKLTLDNIAHRGHYAFINFRETDAAEKANERCWTLSDEILETNVRYPRES
jgi:hypothetical protein